MSDSRPNRTRRWLATSLLALSCGGIGSGRIHARGAGANFLVFDALLQRGKPNLSRRGLVPMLAVADVWQGKGPQDYVDERGIVAILERLPSDTRTLYVDVENWRLLGVAENVRDQNVQNYLQTARIIRRTRPQIKFGFYGVAPSCVYWPIVRQDQKSLAEWHDVNRAMRPIAEVVDFVLPSLYTFYDDPAGWRQFASATIDEARQYGKPVYPFLWFEYFDHNPVLRGRQVRLADWREELALCRQHADGMVLWGGYEQDWSESAGWWQAVLGLLPAATKATMNLREH
jgi:hypothetical protein